MSERCFDVVVLGGGPAGLATAIGIASKGIQNVRVLVVEQHNAAMQRVGENIPPETLVVLKKLGVGKVFRQDGHQVCPGFASVWGKDAVGYNDFIVNPHGNSWRINRKAFDAMLVKRAKALGVEVMFDTRFVNASWQAGRYDLQLHSKQTDSDFMVKTSMVIEATGSSANFAKNIGINKLVDDRLVATVRFASLNQEHKGKQVLIEATNNGWCYHSLLPQRKVVSMVVSAQKQSMLLKADDYRQFEHYLADTQFISKALSKLQLHDACYHSYPIISGVLSKLVGDNWLAVGDAAASFDPIAAQGIYKALQQGLLASDKVCAWLVQKGSNDDFIDTIAGDYAAAIKAHYQLYIDNRAKMYCSERRFVESEFWQSRLSL